MIAEARSVKKSITNTYEKERGKPIPSLDHSLIQLRLGHVLLRDYDKLFTFVSVLSFELSPKDATPGICVYPKMSRQIGRQADVIKMKEPPIITIEILSPTQALDTVIEKYGRNTSQMASSLPGSSSPLCGLWRSTCPARTATNSSPKATSPTRLRGSK
jgi:hypothetical protein